MSAAKRNITSASKDNAVQSVSKAVEDANVVDVPQELTADWQKEYLTRCRLDKARIPERFAGKSFDNFKTERNPKRKDIVAAAQSYVNCFNFKNNSPDGLLIHGVVGCGKTHIAVAILQGVIQKGYTGLYYNLPDLLMNIRATYDSGSGTSESELIEDLNTPDLLVMDDLGAEAAKDWVNDRLYLVINRRYESCKPVIVTTNLDLAELTQKLGERTVSRLCEMCHSFSPYPEEDYRKKNMH